MTGRVFFLWATSEASLPVVCSAPQMPSRSSLSWKAMPERPAEAAVAGDDVLVVGGEQRRRPRSRPR